MKILLLLLICKISFAARPDANFHLGAGVGLSTLKVPNAQFELEIRFFHHFTLGIGAITNISSGEFKLNSSSSGLSSPNNHINSLGPFLSLNFYSRPYLSGIWGRVGIGAETFRAGNAFMSGDKLAYETPYFLGLGWRWMSYETLSFSLGCQAFIYKNIWSNLFSKNTNVIVLLFSQIGFSFEAIPH